MQPDQYIRIVGHRKNVRDIIVDDRYREALEKIAAADYHEDGDVARAALNPITAE